MKTFRLLVVFLVFCVTIVLSSIASAEDYIDLAAKITHVYVNDTGLLLIRVDAQHGSRDGYLQIDGPLADPVVKTLYSNALVAQTTNQSCWVRVIPRDGYWKVNIIQFGD